MTTEPQVMVMLRFTRPGRIEAVLLRYDVAK